MYSLSRNSNIISNRLATKWKVHRQPFGWNKMGPLMGLVGLQKSILARKYMILCLRDQPNQAFDLKKHLCKRHLTHWGRDKMDAFSQATFSSAFCRTKMFDSRLIVTAVCSLGSNKQYASIGWVNGLAPSRWQAIIWTNDGIFYRRIYASFGLNELRDHGSLEFYRIVINNAHCYYQSFMFQPKSVIQSPYSNLKYTAKCDLLLFYWRNITYYSLLIFLLFRATYFCFDWQYHNIMILTYNFIPNMGLHHMKNYPIARFMEPTWGPPGSCRPQMGPMLAPWTYQGSYHDKWKCSHQAGCAKGKMILQFLCNIGHAYRMHYPNIECISSLWYILWFLLKSIFKYIFPE